MRLCEFIWPGPPRSYSCWLDHASPQIHILPRIDKGCKFKTVFPTPWELTCPYLYVCLGGSPWLWNPCCSPPLHPLPDHHTEEHTTSSSRSNSWGLCLLSNPYISMGPWWFHALCMPFYCGNSLSTRFL